MPTRPANTVYRDEVKAAVAAGMARFLSSVEVEALTDVDEAGERRFLGFTVLTLRPAAAWLSFDIVPGDVITRVNGVSVSHYDYLLPMFEGLGSASELRVEMLRGGKPKTLVISILDRGGGSSAVESPSPSADSAAKNPAPSGSAQASAAAPSPSSDAPATGASEAQKMPASDEPKTLPVPAASKTKKKQKQK